MVLFDVFCEAVLLVPAQRPFLTPWTSCLYVQFNVFCQSTAGAAPLQLRGQLLFQLLGDDFDVLTNVQAEIFSSNGAWISEQPQVSIACFLFTRDDR